jgi:hypothetical protein
VGKEQAIQLLEKLLYYVADVGTTDDPVILFRISLNEINCN